ncbi:MAG: substrate-binding domain-containing protein [Spirochaetia bacterium]
MKERSPVSVALVMVMSLALFGLGSMLNPMHADAQKKLQFIFVNQWGPGAFPSVVKQGMDDAAKALGVDAQIVFLARNDDLAAQLSAFESALLKNPDGIITTIPSATAFNKLIQQALDKGIPVICSNTDGLIGTGNPLEHKVPYIGSSLFAGGYDIARKAVEMFPDKTNIRALVGLEAPGASWCEERAGGAVKYLEEQKIPYEKIDLTQDMGTMESRVSAYLRKHPDCNLVMSQGGNGPFGTAKGIESAGKKPGEVINVGYDITPQNADELKKGFVTLLNDQQPYLQGYLPVVQLYMMKMYALSGWDVNTGLGYVDKNNIDKVFDLVQKRVR